MIKQRFKALKTKVHLETDNYDIIIDEKKNSYEGF